MNAPSLPQPAGLRPPMLALVMLFLAVTMAARLATAASGTAPLQPAVDEFYFVVLGDSQLDDPPAFNRLIDQISQVRPALVIQVGDLINGYQDDQQLINAEWQRFRDQIKPLGDIPWFPVAGNHDLYGADKVPTTAMEALYRKQWGDLYYTFEYRNARFIVLNSDPAGSPGKIDDDQLAWLKGVLAANLAPHVFVFLHRPPASLKNEEVLHTLFTENKVGYVFYGHHHHHHELQRDGVRYVMTNATGDTPLTSRITGSEDHFLLMHVRDQQSGYAVIAADSITAAGMVSPEDNAAVYNMTRGLQDLNPISQQQLDVADDGTRTARLLLSNPTDRSVEAYVQWDSPDKRWRFAPSAAARVILPIGTRNKPVEVTLSRPDGSRPEGWPSARVQVPIQTSNGHWVLVDETVQIAAPGTDSGK